MIKAVFMGTPDFAVPSFEKLFDVDGVKVVAAVTNRDKEVGRKRVLTAPPVKVKAMERGVPVFQYDRIRKEGVEDIKKLEPDVIVTCAFGQILSQEIIDIPKYGVINVHASLLPAYRGASPINYAILNGEKRTGVTVMRTDAGIDTGDIIAQAETQIGENETAGELFDRLSVMGAELLYKTFNSIIDKSAVYVKQDEKKATLTKMIKKEDARLDFTESAVKVFNRVRAFNPSPVAYAFFNGEKYKFFSVRPLSGKYGKSGEITSDSQSLIIGCGDGGIEVIELQKEGGKRLNVKDFLRGNKFPAGSSFS